MTELEALNFLYHYDPATGLLTWEVNSTKDFSQIGKQAGSLDVHGYRQVKFLGKMCKGHRLIWLYMTGEWPAKQIDHKDGVRSNNRWGNLRLATGHQNNQNQHNPRTDNTSGFLGVSYNKNAKKFSAKIGVNG